MREQNIEKRRHFPPKNEINHSLEANVLFVITVVVPFGLFDSHNQARSAVLKPIENGIKGRIEGLFDISFEARVHWFLGGLVLVINAQVLSRDIIQFRNNTR